MSECFVCISIKRFKLYSTEKEKCGTIIKLGLLYNIVYWCNGFSVTDNVDTILSKEHTTMSNIVGDGELLQQSINS